MRLHLLGPLELRVGGRVREVGQPRRRAVLAALATDAGRPVPVDTLIDRVWDADPPDGARSVLYAHISRLRRLLEDAASTESEGAPRDGEGGALRIVRASGGYVLEADENAVDLLLFRALVARGRLCPTEAERVRVLEEALRLWRGVPLPEQVGAWSERMRTVWTGERIEAALAWAGALLHEGRPQEVPALLRPLAAEHPLSEPLAVMLVRALGEAGRSAEAVHAYIGIRRQLADELGVSPGRELRAMYAELLSESDTGQPSAEPRPVPAPA
ncbi:AfsR/SARP family transcriptional regulator, partial [Streptomyces europaeiscabiei]